MVRFRENVKEIIFVLLAFLMLLDFAMPGNEHIEQVRSVNKRMQQYYNAAGNYHYSYSVDTDSYHFPISENFAQSISGQQWIKVKVSLIFKEINTYEPIDSDKKETYSLRWASGLILPLTAIFVLLIGFKYRRLGNPIILIIDILLTFNLVLLLS